jgi:NADPH2:quinone reductase
MSNHTRAGDQLRTITGLYNRGALRPPELTILPLEEAGEAQRRVKDGHVRGKILLHVADL